MNNQNPFYLYKYNKREFLSKPCALCLSTLFYPESGDTFVSCCRLKCNHMFHINCINQSINANYLSCPECRDPINNVNSIKNIDKSDIAFEITKITKEINNLIRNRNLNDALINGQRLELGILNNRRKYHLHHADKEVNRISMIENRVK